MFFTVSCGSDLSLLPTKDKKVVNTFYSNDAILTEHADQYVVKGSWSAIIYHSEDGLNLSKSKFSFDSSTQVGRHTDFKVSDDYYSAPESLIDGVYSFGKFSLAKLRDNNLNVCGDSKDERCQSAAIRIYTTGTPGEGYWNFEENYGLPIYTGNLNVPHLNENALFVDEIDLTGIRVLKLEHFSDKVKNIPISIDFSDAVYGEYQTEIIIDYILF